MGRPEETLTKGIAQISRERGLEDDAWDDRAARGVVILVNS